MFRNFQHISQLFLYIISGSYSSPITASYQISAGNEDAEEYVSGGLVLPFAGNDSSDLEFCYTSRDAGAFPDEQLNQHQVVGLSFVNPGIPAGSLISDTYVQFTADETGSGAVGITIRGEYHHTAQVFDGTINDIGKRPRTNASVLWSPPDWNSVGARTSNEITNDVSSILQEIISHPSYTTSSRFNLFFNGDGVTENTRWAEAYDGVPASAPELFISYATMPLDLTDLLSYWKFDQNGNDSVSAHNAVITGGYDSDGKIDYSLLGTNTSGYGIVPDSADLSFGNGTTDSPFSIGAWVWFDSVETMWFANKRESHTTLNEYVFGYITDGVVLSLADDTNANYVTIKHTFTPTLDTWYHFMATYSGGSNVGGDGIKIYVNGIEQTTSTDAVGTYTAMNATAADFYIGTAGFLIASGNYGLNGKMDMLQLWKKELSAVEVEQIYDIENSGVYITDQV